LVGGADPDNNKHWDDFVHKFETTFMDTGWSQMAFNQLIALTMSGSDLDTVGILSNLKPFELAVAGIVMMVEPSISSARD
jgi:hypothetical protein